MKAATLAEAATLGSLLVDPTAVGRVVGWLRAADFADPWHTEVYTVILERHAAREQVDAEQVGLHLRNRLGPQHANLPRILDLLRTAPVPPQPLRYAAMVLESSLRREVAGQGVLLRAAALSAALARESGPVTVGTAMVDAALTAGEQRWKLATGESAPGVRPVRAGLEPVLRNTDRAVAADRFLTAHPPVDLREVREHEQRLIAALVCHPSQVSWTARWLRPDALFDRPWRAVYSALIDLVDRGDPVDVVTLAWEVQHASRRAGPGPDTATLLRAVDAAAADDPGYLGRLVAGDLVRRTADTAAQALSAAAANPGVDVRDLFETGRLHTGSVRAAATALPDQAGEVLSGRRLHALPVPHMPAKAAALAGPVAG